MANIRKEDLLAFLDFCKFLLLSLFPHLLFSTLLFSTFLFSSLLFSFSVFSLKAHVSSCVWHRSKRYKDLLRFHYNFFLLQKSNQHESKIAKNNQHLLQYFLYHFYWQNIISRHKIRANWRKKYWHVSWNCTAMHKFQLNVAKNVQHHLNIWFKSRNLWSLLMSHKRLEWFKTRMRK